MTIYDDAVAAGQNASRAVVETALAEREAATAAEKARADQLTIDLANANRLLATVKAQAGTLQEQVDTLEAQVVDLEAQIADLESQIPVPEPPPAPVSTTKFGACVTNGGALVDVATKFGDTPPVRHFATTTIAWSAAPAGTSVHRSFKPAYSVTDATIDSMLKSAEADAVKNNVVHLVTFHHESDNDTGMGDLATRTERIKQMNRLYDRKEALGLEHVKVVPVYTGGLFASYSTQAERDLWKTAKGDYLGIDMDGVHTADTATDYATNYDDETANAVKFVAANGFKGWTVPEFGTSRRSFDSTGSKRAAWFTKWGNHFKANGAVQVLAYDYDTTSHNGATTDYNQLRSGTPEHTAWKALVATN